MQFIQICWNLYLMCSQILVRYNVWRDIGVNTKIAKSTYPSHTKIFSLVWQSSGHKNHVIFYCNHSNHPTSKVWSNSPNYDIWQTHQTRQRNLLKQAISQKVSLPQEMDSDQIKWWWVVLQSMLTLPWWIGCVIPAEIMRCYFILLS